MSFIKNISLPFGHSSIGNCQRWQNILFIDVKFMDSMKIIIDFSIYI